MTESCRRLLITWYDRNARTLPWRGIHDPYRTWVSETMLQQTRVETVLGYYERFLTRFPTVQALADAQQDEVLKLWEGLGYYSRARNLHRGAQQVVAEHGGVIPRDVAALRRISGIGPYTAGAIASIAYDVPVPAVDGNVIRVVSRLCGIRENVGTPSVRRALEEKAAELVPGDRPGDFNQAMMDLGATVCVPGTPGCDRCPLCGICDACEAGDAEELPVLPRKNPPKQLVLDVCLIVSGDRVLMRQRTERMLHGLWVFPMLERQEKLQQAASQVMRCMKLRVSGVREEGEARHVFTHQVWNMRLLSMETAPEAVAPGGMRFVTLAETEHLAIPSAMRAALQRVIQILGE
ncbi:MAG: A/G-specific adenine glycosylase [Aristaeellaceae bacterium]